MCSQRDNGAYTYIFFFSIFAAIFTFCVYHANRWPLWAKLDFFVHVSTLYNVI